MNWRICCESVFDLLQQAHNPVNWFPWSEHRFVIATCDNKPIFLSIWSANY
ncbi:DUF255 domain-containing protein [Paenibacillus macquariensis]|uniref:DUF255 domain-containing protein n=1 Tax=Paenibacillus macquariensis TaxID=948756 RepID=UPI000970907E|nr:DUF255 domain-containing protein [Paenibacillus macquariensis]MEC0089567.1 DUF255 domain-containing protein [Paenibacillus macquariensis]